ncbi:hypothetical protein MGG_15445 [Pyricularia oryzae 70-15]|uniref:Uncharacterized protein n=1 Tax=Pyricularia oryzae (strain 70-15 / ATCC MYA-4617 / FGSC 8958) TaxID=242507 RepID=G4NJY9_PYRO7|nr:uncharacterized protein MGG_15445 [Pyricularia oryzae 70-15]EHA45757.1 hypothetical protein MGG_15445 [Pyricularia oryzae 70-15]
MPPFATDAPPDDNLTKVAGCPWDNPIRLVCISDAHNTALVGPTSTGRQPRARCPIGTKSSSLATTTSCWTLTLRPAHPDRELQRIEGSLRRDLDRGDLQAADGGNLAVQAKGGGLWPHSRSGVDAALGMDGFLKHVHFWQQKASTMSRSTLLVNAAVVGDETVAL